MDEYTKLQTLFEDNRNKENAVSMKKYMRNKFIFYGIKTPLRRALTKELIKTHNRQKQIDWSLLDNCFASEYREFQYLVIDYLKALHQHLTYQDIPHIYPYIKSKQWWDTIDGFNKIIGDLGLRDKQVDELMLHWSKDKDFWIRRLAIDHQLSRKEQTNTELLAQILINNFGSDEFFVNKAIGWALRDYSKTNPTWVKKFIEKYGSQMHKLSIKEGSKYI